MRAFIQSRLTGLSTAILVAAILGIGGCGGGDDEDGGDSSGESRSSNPKSNKGRRSSTKQVSTEAGPRTIDGIPLDVFFDEPILIAQQQQTVGGGAVNPGPELQEKPPTKDGEPENATTPEPTTAEISWDKVITAEMLKAEMKSLRNQLQQRLTALSAYNSSTLEIPVFATDLALMGEIARRHPEDISWKEDAKYISVLAAKMVEVTSSSNARGRKSFDDVSKSFLSICDILDGNSPPDLPEAEEADYADVADMGYLMKRLQIGQDWMQNNVSNEDNFAENQEAAQREASVFAALSQVFSTEGYGYGDDEEFTEHANQMRDAAAGMIKAAADKNFADFDTLSSKVGQKCDECHRTYRTGG